MSYSQALSPCRDTNGGFAHEDKDELDVTSTDNAIPRDPHASYRHTPYLESESDSEETIAHGAPDTPPTIILSGDEPILTALDRTGPRVRFRSRVRITAGLGRRRHADGLSSDASSISGSPCSSISAPLRTHYTGSNGWGPLGTRTKFSASQAALVPPCQDDGANGVKVDLSENGSARKRCARTSWMVLDDDADEYTHLLMPGTRYSYVGRHVHDGFHDNRERERERERTEQWWRERLVDETFGKWPGRLLNRHWWWWHLEPILCCLCEPDDDE